MLVFGVYQSTSKKILARPPQYDRALTRAPL